LRNWLNPGAGPDPLPFLSAGGEAILFAGGLVEPFPPATAVPFPDEEDRVGGVGSSAAGRAPVTELGSALSAGGCGFPFARELQHCVEELASLPSAGEEPFADPG
jgi:hypothetical protein